MGVSSDSGRGLLSPYEPLRIGMSGPPATLSSDSLHEIGVLGLAACGEALGLLLAGLAACNGMVGRTVSFGSVQK